MLDRDYYTHLFSMWNSFNSMLVNRSIVCCVDIEYYYTLLLLYDILLTLLLHYSTLLRTTHTTTTLLLHYTTLLHTTTYYSTTLYIVLFARRTLKLIEQRNILQFRSCIPTRPWWCFPVYSHESGLSRYAVKHKTFVVNGIGILFDEG